MLNDRPLSSSERALATTWSPFHFPSSIHVHSRPFPFIPVHFPSFQLISMSVPSRIHYPIYFRTLPPILVLSRPLSSIPLISVLCPSIPVLLRGFSVVVTEKGLAWLPQICHGFAKPILVTDTFPLKDGTNWFTSVRPIANLRHSGGRFLLLAKAQHSTQQVS